MISKKEAIEKFVERDLNPIPQEWVKIVAEAKHAPIYGFPMWGTMWFLDTHLGEKLYTNARRMLSGLEELKDEIAQGSNSNLSKEEINKLQKAIDEEDWSVLEEYISEEMGGQDCILDKDGKTTAIFIYEIEGEYLIGINGAGWNFYEGVWDKLYDLIGLKWHDEK